jgi:hypothetical protein
MQELQKCQQAAKESGNFLGIDRKQAGTKGDTLSE